MLSTTLSISILVQHTNCIQIKHNQLYQHRKRHSYYTCSVEWNPQFLSTSSKPSSLDKLVDSVDYFVLPDLPSKYSQDDRANFFKRIPYEKQMTTLATCRHTTKESLLHKIMTEFSSSSILLVSGDDKNQISTTDQPVLSSIDAARILLSRVSTEGQHCPENDEYDDDSRRLKSTSSGDNDKNNKLVLWSVINPNDPNSIEHIHNKINVGGITNFITQPFLSSNATHIFHSYPMKSTSASNTTSDIRYVIGMAMPQTTKNLLYWIRLLEQPELIHDPLFQRHVEYFASLEDSTTSTRSPSHHDDDSNRKMLKLSKMSEWIQNEISYITSHTITTNTDGDGDSSSCSETTRTIDGFHFMPINKVNDKLDPLIHIIQELKMQE